MVAYWTDGQKTRLLSAGHCAAAAKLLGMDISVSQDGANFTAGKMVATGWKVKADAFCGFMDNPRKRLKDNDDKAWAESLSDCANTDAGDWSIWEVQSKLNVVPLGTNRDLKRGDALYIIGYPIGGDAFSSSGTVSNVKYRAPQTPWDGYIASDFTALPGSSGSGVFTEDGRIVGILVAGAGDTFHLTTPIDLVWKEMPCLQAAVVDVAVCVQPVYHP